MVTHAQRAITAPYSIHVFCASEGSGCPASLVLYPEYLEPLTFREADLKFVFLVPRLAALRIITIFAADFGGSTSCVPVSQAEGTLVQVTLVS